MGGFFHKGTNSIHGGHDLITSQKPYLLIPSQGGGAEGLGAQHEFVGTQTFSP